MTPNLNQSLSDASAPNPEIEALLQGIKGVEKFLEKLGSKEPTPGGGATAALMGAIACAQASMVAELSVANKKCQRDASRMATLRNLVTEFKALQERFLAQIAEDAKAYGELSSVFKMQRDSEERRQARHVLLQEKLEAATVPPFAILTLSKKGLLAVFELLEVASTMSRADLIVAALALKASARGAEAMVLANTCYLTDSQTRQHLEKKAAEMATKADAISNQIYACVTKKDA